MGLRHKLRKESSQCFSFFKIRKLKTRKGRGEKAKERTRGISFRPPALLPARCLGVGGAPNPKTRPAPNGADALDASFADEDDAEALSRKSA